MMNYIEDNSMKEMINKKLYMFFIRYNYIYRNFFNLLDPEIKWIPKLINRRKRAIDIGANIGIYTRILSKLFDTVESFEPIEKVSLLIKKANLRNVNIHQYALSNNETIKEFRIPLKNGVPRYGNSSLEKTIFNKFEENEKIQIKSKTLDGYNFNQVDFIKIDVEGHEIQTIEGAKQTIKKNLPLILIEIEGRHLPQGVSIYNVFSMLNDLGYDGYYVYNNKLKSVNHFNEDIHQKKFLDNNSRIKLSDRDKLNLYINNFFFISKNINHSK